MPRTFKAVTDLLGLSIDELAELLGVSAQSVKQARLAPSSAGHRTPPAGWERELAAVVRQRADELLEVAEELEGDARNQR